MIEWLVQTCEENPALAQGAPPPGLLCAAEAARFAALKSDKRRRDWLLGRWTAKHLLQVHVLQTTGKYLPLDSLVVENDVSRAPYAVVLSEEVAERLPACLSISHSRERAFCALLSGASIGADIEFVEDRPPGFAETYFTPEEAEQVSLCKPADRPWLETAIWSAKEAVLKAVRLGLSVDTRSLTCQFEASAAADDRWRPFRVKPGLRHLTPTPGPIQGWVRRLDGFVLALAVYPAMPAPVGENPVMMDVKREYHVQ